MILIGLGANLPGPFGSPEEALQACVPVFADKGFPVVHASHIWESAPVPVSDQPWYRNAVAEVETDLSPQALIKALHEIEHDFGRVRTVRNAPRVLDLDLLAYGTLVLDEGGLHLPHPRMHMRAFVLFPLREIAPDWRHPVLEQSVDEMIVALPDGQDIRLVETGLLRGDKNAA